MNSCFYRPIRVIFIILISSLAMISLFASAKAEEKTDEQPGVFRTIKESSWDDSPAAIGTSHPQPSRQTHKGPVVHSMTLPETEKSEFYIELFSSPEYREWLLAVQKRSLDYLPYIKEIVNEYEVPREIAYLPAVESAFRSHAVSSSGAAGLWQFMLNSISPFDIVVDQWRDDRRDFMKSTRGAIRKLKYNYSILGDWYLSLAAYNCGLGRIERTIGSSGINDYFKLAEKGLLPRETAEYVPRFIAAAHILSYPGRFGLPLQWEKPILWEAVPLDQAVDLKILASRAEVPLERLLTGNSELRFGITPPGSSKYELKVPAEYSDSIKEVLSSGSDRLIRFYIHPVASGDTYYALGRHFGIPVDLIIDYNPGVNPSSLRIGQKIIIPAFKETGPYRRVMTTATGNYQGVYTVTTGDSFWSISRNYGITPEELAMNNGLDLNGILKVGTRLQVPDMEESDDT